MCISSGANAKEVVQKKRKRGQRRDKAEKGFFERRWNSAPGYKDRLGMQVGAHVGLAAGSRALRNSFQ